MTYSPNRGVEAPADHGKGRKRRLLLFASPCGGTFLYGEAVRGTVYVQTHTGCPGKVFLARDYLTVS
jgi:hypothetical protein